MLQTELDPGSRAIAEDRVGCRRWKFKLVCARLDLGEHGHTFNKPDVAKYLPRLVRLLERSLAGRLY